MNKRYNDLLLNTYNLNSFKHQTNEENEQKKKQKHQNYLNDSHVCLKTSSYSKNEIIWMKEMAKRKANLNINHDLHHTRLSPGVKPFGTALHTQTLRSRLHRKTNGLSLAIACSVAIAQMQTSTKNTK